MAALKKKKIVKKMDSLSRSPRAHTQKVVKKIKVFDLKKPTKKLTRKVSSKVVGVDLKRAAQNPIIEPAPNLRWESKATLNPTAFYHDGKVHIVYRAIGDNDSSVLGYAASYDG